VLRPLLRSSSPRPLLQETISRLPIHSTKHISLSVSSTNTSPSMKLTTAATATTATTATTISPNTTTSYRAFADQRLNGMLASVLGRRNDLKVAALPLEADKVQVIPTPAAFLESLKEGVSKAQRSITLASLYLGTGAEAIELVELVRRACAERPQLQVHFLVDCMRGHRLTLEGTSSVLLLRSLLTEFPDQVRVSLFHTPALRGIWKWILPDRWNEIAGVQHMKAYIFDDDVIISGANLSKSYFTDRTDRYMLLRDSAPVASYYARLIDTVASFSYALAADGELRMPDGCPDPVERPLPFTRFAKDRVDIFSHRESINTLKLLAQPPSSSGIDTWAFPTVQGGTLRIHQDEEFTHRFFRNQLVGSELSIISPYFNFTRGYAKELLHHNLGLVSILTAPPKANSFYNSHGVSRGLPLAYSMMEHKFFKQVARSKQLDRIHIHECSIPENWTFHAKGLFYTLPGQKMVSGTCVGSPNYGYRSVDHDLEAQLCIFTENEALRQRLTREKDQLFENAEPVTAETFARPDRLVSLWIRVTTRFIRTLM